MSDPELHAIYGDLLDGAGAAIPDESVDMALFSPPYKSSDGFSLRLMNVLGDLLGRVLKPGSWAFMNFGQLSDDFGRPFAAQAALLGSGGQLQTHQTLTWIKSYAKDDVTRGHFQPLNSDYFLNYCFEFVFTYFKPPKPKFDRLSLGVPYMDKSNMKRGTRGKNGDRHCKGDVWVLDPEAGFDAVHVPYETTGASTKKKHAYEYPEALVEHCFKVAGLKPGMTIFDPFMGSGTTVAVAKRLGLHAYATERDRETLDGAVARWESACNGTAQ